MNPIELVGVFQAESPSLLLLGLALIAVARVVQWRHSPLSVTRDSSRVPAVTAL